jgi:hypothetical protein
VIRISGTHTHHAKQFPDFHQAQDMNPPRIFISHTDSDELQRRMTTAVSVELRRIGIDVWIDRDHRPPHTTLEQEAAGPTPQNPLFNHIVDAMSHSDALLFVVSPASFEREYVRLEFDPRVLGRFALVHPDVRPDKLPVFLALVEPIIQSTPLWTLLVDGSFAGRVLNLTGVGPTPLILPIALMGIVREIAPARLFPLSPATEWFSRAAVENKAAHAPGCPEGVPPSTWLRFENLFGLGPVPTEKSVLLARADVAATDG